MNILITAIGSFSAKCVITKLIQNGHYIVGTDIYPKEWHLESYLCNKFYQAPYATWEEEYIGFLSRICETEGINILLPLTDLEIDVINKYRPLFKEKGIILAMPSKETLYIARNKYQLFTFFKDNDKINVPLTFKCPCRNNSLSFPLIAKPINGRSSEGLKIIGNERELNTVIENPNYIIQEFIEGQIITVDYVRNARSREAFYIPRKEYLRTKNGAGMTVEIFSDDRLTPIVSEIGTLIDVNGCINMEFLFSHGKYFLIDINPRFSAGVAFSCQTGYDMVTSHLNCHIGKEIMPSIKFRDHICVKNFIEHTTRYAD